MTHVAIVTNIPGSMAVHAPSHRLVYFAADSMHLSDRAVTGRALDARPNVRLMGVKSVRFRLDPVDALPRWLFFTFSVRRQFLNLRAFGLNRLVATHAGGDVWNRRVRRLVRILVTERALELRSFFSFFCHVLPVIELNRLERSFRSGGRAQQHESDHQDHHNHKH